MSYHFTSSEEPNTYRALLIVVETRPSYGGYYRHISARVIRAAKADEVVEGKPTRYNDGKHVQGYRWADWSSHKSNAVYVAGLRVRGQMDMRGGEFEQMNGGQPYGNDLEFESSTLRKREVLRMSATFNRLEKISQKMNKDGIVFDSSFSGQVKALAFMLGIKHFVIDTSKNQNSNLDNRSAYKEFGHDEVDYYVSKMVDEVHRDA